MTDKTYPYDESLPYVVLREGDLVARFAEAAAAHHFADQRWRHEVIDTTPAPRVPEDARFITYRDSEGVRDYATRIAGEWVTAGSTAPTPLEDLPGVTPDTVFTVLEERKP